MQFGRVDPQLKSKRDTAGRKGGHLLLEGEMTTKRELEEHSSWGTQTCRGGQEGLLQRAALLCFWVSPSVSFLVVLALRAGTITVWLPVEHFLCTVCPLLVFVFSFLCNTCYKSLLGVCRAYLAQQQCQKLRLTPLTINFGVAGFISLLIVCFVCIHCMCS